MKLIAQAAIAAILATSLTGCHIYKSYETPQDTPLTKEYAEALKAGGGLPRPPPPGSFRLYSE